MSTLIEVFCCYAREDKNMLEQLRKHLALLWRQGQIAIWSDIDLHAGAEWERELHQHLESADIILLLISPDFISSDYCYSTIMQRAIKRHDEDRVQVIPILLRPTFLQDAPFAKFQVIPTDGKSVTEWPDQDSAFYHITVQINQGVLEVYRRRVQLPVDGSDKVPHSAMVPPVPPTSLIPEAPLLTDTVTAPTDAPASTNFAPLPATPPVRPPQVRPPRPRFWKNVFVLSCAVLILLIGGTGLFLTTITSNTLRTQATTTAQGSTTTSQAISSGTTAPTQARTAIKETLDRFCLYVKSRNAQGAYSLTTASFQKENIGMTPDPILYPTINPIDCRTPNLNVIQLIAPGITDCYVQLIRIDNNPANSRLELQPVNGIWKISAIYSMRTEAENSRAIGCGNYALS